MDILSLFKREPGLQKLPIGGNRPIALNGLQGQGSLLAAAHLCKELNHPGILILSREAGVSEILATLRALLGEKVYYLPEREFMFDTFSAH